MSSDNSKSPLEAAQKIVAELAGMNAEHQLLALKFSIETLGLQLPNVSLPLPPLTPIVHTPGQLPPPAASSGGHSTDIKSFVEMKSPNSAQQFAAVVAYFYQFEAKPDGRKDAIDPDTMKDAARLAGWPQSPRWRMTLTNAKNAGYLDSAGSGQYKLSSVGENLVAITLPEGNGVGGGKSNNASRKARGKTAKQAGKKASKKGAKKK